MKLGDDYIGMEVLVETTALNEDNQDDEAVQGNNVNEVVIVWQQCRWKKLD